MDHEKLIGILTFREVIKTLALHRGTVDGLAVRSVMSAQPLTCSMDTELDEVRRIMLTHQRYRDAMPRF
jgi:CBS domain-containing protein